MPRHWPVTPLQQAVLALLVETCTRHPGRLLLLREVPTVLNSTQLGQVVAALARKGLLRAAGLTYRADLKPVRVGLIQEQRGEAA